jgi:hypothetical protein
MRTLGVALILAGVVLSGLEPGAGAPAATSRVIDRTFSCSMDLQAGVRRLYAAAQTGYQESPGKWKWLPSAILTTSGVERPGPDSTTIAGISAGSRDQLGSARVWIGTGRCRPDKADVGLSPRGLKTRTADLFSDYYVCTPPARVLLRVRAVFRAPAALTFRTGLGELRADGAVEEASFAVETQAGKPLLYAAVAKSGRTRFFSTACSAT